MTIFLNSLILLKQSKGVFNRFTSNKNRINPWKLSSNLQKKRNKKHRKQGIFKLPLILIQDIPSLGNKGDIIRVKRGYARYDLLPNNKAVYITEQTIKQYNIDMTDFKWKESSDINITQSNNNKKGLNNDINSLYGMYIEIKDQFKQAEKNFIIYIDKDSKINITKNQIYLHIKRLVQFPFFYKEQITISNELNKSFSNEIELKDEKKGLEMINEYGDYNISINLLKGLFPFTPLKDLKTEIPIINVKFLIKKEEKEIDNDENEIDDEEYRRKVTEYLDNIDQK